MNKTLVFVALIFSLVALGTAQTLSLKLSGGGGYILGGDVAKGLQGQTDYVHSEYGSTGVYNFPNLGWGATGELLIHLGSRFAIGLGAGYESHARESVVPYTISYISAQETIKPAIDVIPVLAGLHWFIPLGAAAKIDLMVGGGAYLTRLKWHSTYDISLLGLSGNDVYDFSASKTGFGGYAGLGLELSLSSKLALVLNVIGRYARVSGFTGDWAETGSGDFWTFSDSGSGHGVYYYDWTTGGTTFPQIVFQSDLPSGSSVSNAREARLDLSGIAASIGFRLTLF